MGVPVGQAPGRVRGRGRGVGRDVQRRDGPVALVGHCVQQGLGVGRVVHRLPVR